MKNIARLQSILALILLAAPAQASDSGTLLPTTSLANEVKQLSALLSDSPPGTTVETRRLQGLRVQKEITKFITAQMQAFRAISQEQLRKQLQGVLCSELSGTAAECACDQPPYVFANNWAGNRGVSQFIVAYVLHLGFMGPQGSISVVESYMRDNSNGTVRRTAIGGSEFDGYMPNFQMVQQFYGPPEIWVLAWGQVLGGSGRGLHGRVTLYRAKADSVEIAWDDAREDNLEARRNAVGWEVTYADHNLLYGHDPKPYFLDVYSIDYAKRTFSRVVHYQSSPD